MKKIFFLFIAAAISMGSRAQFTSASLQAAGLTCAMCSKAINKSLDQLAFVKEVKPDISNSTFNITFKEGVNVDFDALKKAVEDAGFSVAKLKVTGSFDHVTVNNDAHVQVDGKTFHFLHVNNQVLNGPQSITLVDKDFVSSKEFKKFSTATSMPCIQTGKAGACCTKDGVKQNTRIYHVTI